LRWHFFRHELTAWSAKLRIHSVRGAGFSNWGATMLIDESAGVVNAAGSLDRFVGRDSRVRSWVTMLLALAVTMGGSWSLVWAEPSSEFRACSQAQFQACLCVADSRCAASNPPPQNGYCWIGDVTWCTSSGDCGGGCYEYPEEDGWCDMTVPGC
jgi:hypothetical protein